MRSSLHATIFIAASCSSSSKPEARSAPAVPEETYPSRTDPTAIVMMPDAANDVAMVPDASAPEVIDNGHPRIFPWQSLRGRDPKVPATPKEEGCDLLPPASRPVRCDNVPGARLAARVLLHRYESDDLILELDRGSDYAVSTEYFVSLLDRDDRPMTRWVHPSAIHARSSRVRIPHAGNLHDGIKRAAIVEKITPDERFPDTDLRSAR